MIKSTLKTFGFLDHTNNEIVMVIGTFLFCSFLKDPIEKDLYICRIWAFIMLSLLIPQLWVISRSVILNSNEGFDSLQPFFHKSTNQLINSQISTGMWI